MKQTEIIERLGGTKAVAALCGVTLGAVSQWKRSGIPEARLMYLKLARTDVDWAYLSGTDCPTKEAA